MEELFGEIYTRRKKDYSNKEFRPGECPSPEILERCYVTKADDNDCTRSEV